MLALVSVSFLLLAAPQDPGDVIARYRLLDRDAVVTRTDLALEMGFHLRRRDQGRQAINQMVDTTLTRRFAEKHGLMPSDAEVRKFWDELQRQLRDAGRDPRDVPVVRNSSEAQWLADLAVQMAQERAVRRELGLEASEAVSGEMMKLWMQEQRKQAKVVLEPDALPAGSVARIDDADLPVVELGMLLLRTSDDDERDRFVRQVVFHDVLEATCRRDGVDATPADLDAAIAQRRAEAGNDPRFRGATLESMLEAEGLTPASLRELRVFRAKVLLQKLAQQRFPATALAEELVRDRAKVLEQVGPQRRLAIVFVNALEVPNELVKRDHAAAMQYVATLRTLLDKETFEAVAGLKSEHGQSRQKGGDIGWHRRRSERVPEPVLAAAFALAAGEVSQPIRTDEGAFLVKVLEIEPEPSQAVLIERLRELRAQELGRQLLLDASIEIVRPANERSAKANAQEAGK